MYDATQGRFLQRDPAGPDAGGPDLYAYALDRPVQVVDPLGQDPCQAYKDCFGKNPAARLLYAVCSRAGTSSAANCIRCCLQDHFDTRTCAYNDKATALGRLGAAVLAPGADQILGGLERLPTEIGPLVHAHCFAKCGAVELGRVVIRETLGALATAARRAVGNLLDQLGRRFLPRLW
jgi:hypothetical protein